MRQLLMISLIAVLSFLACKRETNSIDNIFSEYVGQEGVTMLKLPPSLFLAFLEQNNNLPDVSFDNIDIVRYLACKKSESNNLNNQLILKDIYSELTGLLFEDLVSYSKAGDEISVKVLDNGEYISDLMVLVIKDQSLIMIGISGRMKTEDIMKLASEIDFDKLEGMSISN